MTDQAHLRRAIEFAAHGRGTINPNPVVGRAVLDASGQPGGEGFHACADGTHAEVVASRAARERARGGTACVTPEPRDRTGHRPTVRRPPEEGAPGGEDPRPESEDVTPTGPDPRLTAWPVPLKEL
ncbi:hypothetical protein [Streptosporangium sp. NPDC087985]|uniref:hypothetical protein n=1 Tax=Streptosporangium sp. NPDC087985 TaxID=3366196 RepID=UPI00380E5DCD